MKIQTRDELNEYMMLVKACGCIKDMESAIQDLNTYNEEYAHELQPFQCVDRLVDNMNELSDRFDYVKATWKQNQD